jgi:acyl carrier protein
MAISRQDVVAAVKEAEVLDEISNLRDDVKLTEQGVDSLGMFNVLLVLSERFGIEIPDKDADGLNSINQIIEYFNRRLS